MHGQQGRVPQFLPLLEAEEFVLALRRFCATHGAPQFITSDNHQTFKTASHLLQGLYEEDEVQQFLRRMGIKGRFQMPRAPWKDSLKAFRERWRREYLSALRARHDCWSGEPSKLHPGDVMLVKQENKKRATWPLGHVVETYLDDDGVVRSAKVLFEGVESLRAVSHLVPLEIAPSEDDVVEHDDDDGQEGAYSSTAGMLGIVETSGDNQEMAPATTTQQLATGTFDNDANGENNAVSERSESETESKQTDAQGRSARPLRRAATKHEN
ncbi:uncharacterized protein [Palaemon carinicauda]|uniref:uncharacterized protein n=1 Tax=Palaemon carinicauda TaxID=392227 RepID=UPI0035B69EC8